MSISDPKFIYLILLLPAVFGAVFFGEGLSKIIHEEHGGWIHLGFGVFLLTVVGAVLAITL